jgi:hypothetical protein
MSVTIMNVLANILMVGVIITYFNQVRNGSSVPNPATWFTWTTVSVMNAVTYFTVVKGDLWQSFIVFLVTAGFIFVFTYSVLHGKLGAIGIVEVISLILAFGIGVVWKTTGNTDLANLSLQFIFAISFIPTITGLLWGDLREKILPWALAFLSYVCVIIALALKGDVNPVAYAYPIVNGILGNGSVATIIYRQGTRLADTRVK